MFFKTSVYFTRGTPKCVCEKGALKPVRKQVDFFDEKKHSAFLFETIFFEKNSHKALQVY